MKRFIKIVSSVIIVVFFITIIQSCNEISIQDIIDEINNSPYSQYLTYCQDITGEYDENPNSYKFVCTTKDTSAVIILSAPSKTNKNSQFVQYFITTKVLINEKKTSDKKLKQEITSWSSKESNVFEPVYLPTEIGDSLLLFYYSNNLNKNNAKNYIKNTNYELSSFMSKFAGFLNSKGVKFEQNIQSADKPNINEKLMNYFRTIK